MLATLLQATGIITIAVGLGLIYLPLAFLALGAGAVLFGLALERG
jgi:hypothetical protein